MQQHLPWKQVDGAFHEANRILHPSPTVRWKVFRSWRPSAGERQERDSQIPMSFKLSTGDFVDGKISSIELEGSEAPLLLKLKSVLD